MNPPARAIILHNFEMEGRTGAQLPQQVEIPYRGPESTEITSESLDKVVDMLFEGLANSGSVGHVPIESAKPVGDSAFIDSAM